jgi:glyoxalase family protein
MIPLITGIHHVTAFAGNAAGNRRFYTQTLGMDLVKRTVNFDAPSMWHLYYGCDGGAPGTLLTHFAEPNAPRARHGGQEIALVTLSVPVGMLASIEARLADKGTRTTRAVEFGNDGLMLVDPDGMRIRIEESPARQTTAAFEIARVSLMVVDAEATSHFLVQALGFHRCARDAHSRTIRLALGSNGGSDGESNGGSGREIDVVHAPDRAAEAMGAGTIHHVAWRVPDDATQARARLAVTHSDIAVTSVRDRQYFRSVYFRIPGGILFEIATDVPGFAIDEPADALGRELRLPPQYESRRGAIMATLPSLDES